MRNYTLDYPLVPRNNRRLTSSTARIARSHDRSPNGKIVIAPSYRDHVRNPSVPPNCYCRSAILR
jgi:hypothetical protein